MDLDFLRVICWKKRMCVSVCLSNCYNKHVNVWSERRVGAAEGMWLAGLACHTPFVHQPHTTVQPPHASTSTRVVQLGACHWAPVLRSRKKRACPSLVFHSAYRRSANTGAWFYKAIWLLLDNQKAEARHLKAPLTSPLLLYTHLWLPLVGLSSNLFFFAIHFSLLLSERINRLGASSPRSRRRTSGVKNDVASSGVQTVTQNRGRMWRCFSIPGLYNHQERGCVSR